VKRAFYGFRVDTGFSSLSESGFIPTSEKSILWFQSRYRVLISFREWLHSYKQKIYSMFLEPRLFSSLSESGFIPTRKIPASRRREAG